MNNKKALLEFHEVSKYFSLGNGKKVHALEKINLEIYPQEILGLVGESGSGKSTLAKVLTGLHPRDNGSINLDGQDLPREYRAKDFRELSKKMQMIFQDPRASLNPRMTVGEIIAEGPILQGMNKGKALEKAKSWLERVGLAREHSSRYPHEFSGGQQQRIGIARALIMEAQLLICDEAISALDVSVQAQIIHLLKAMQEEMQLSLLFIAHDLAMVRYISDRIAVLYLGSLMEVGPSESVYFEPKHPYTQLLIQSKPLADPKLERQRQVPISHGEAPSPVNLGLGCRFASRCPLATEQCQEATPQLIEVEPQHFVACFEYPSKS